MSASAGRVLVKPRGVYNSGTAYEMLDSVFFNGSSYICLKDSLGHAPTDSEYWQIFAQGAGVISGAFAGACDSLGSAQVKSVIIPPADNFALQKGVIVGVRFTNTNTYEATSENSIALNVNNTGALPIYFGGTASPLGDNVVAFGEAAYTHFYQYDGTNWVFIGRSGVQTAEQTPYDSTKSTKTAIDEAQDLADTNEANIEAIVNVYGSKNLNAYPYHETSKTESGITFTVNSDGSVLVGDSQPQTATANVQFFCHRKGYGQKFIVKDGRYTLTGCPTGGADTSYFLRAIYYDAGGTTVRYDDTGVGVTFDIDNTYDGKDLTDLGVIIVVANGTTIPAGGLLFKPMLRDARISDATYVPYAMTNRELTEDKVNKTDIAYVEKGTNASRQYYAGEFIYVNGVLYRVITTIANGSAFTVGTNIEATSIGKEISKNAAGTYTSIVGYTSVSNLFTTPCDGYVTAFSNTVKTGTFGYRIGDKSGNGIATHYMILSSSTPNYHSDIAFVRAGMTLHTVGTVPSGCDVRFMPLL